MSHKKAVGDKSYGFLHHIDGIQTFINVKSNPDGYIGFRADNKNLMVIKPNGNVGIGAEIPLEKLHIQNGNISIRSNNSLYGSLRLGTSNATYKDYWAGISSYNTGGVDQADLRFYTAYGAQKGERMRITQHGNVGIGTDKPVQAKLVVSGNNLSNVAYQGFYSYFTLHGKQQTGFRIENTGKVLEKYSIYASNRIAAEEFNAFSDARIKTIFGVSNAVKDLEILRKIEITDYTMIDTIGKGNQIHKKVIAQQVKEVYPQAVSSDLTDVIPNIYALSTIKDGWIKTNTKELVIGDKIKLIFSEEEALVDVLEIKGDAIKVASTQEGSVFVYGKQVSDFHTVDYEAIAMLNVSATQALLKRIELLEKEKDTLSRKQKQLEDHLNTSVSRIEKLETLFNNLK